MLTRHTLVISLWESMFIILFLFFSNNAFSQINVVANQVDSYYEIGETATFNITSQQSGQVSYELKYDNFTEPIQTGTLNINAGQTISVTHTSNEAGLVLCSVAMNANNALAAATFSPYKIESFENEPSDFDTFWNNQKDILASIPIDAQLSLHSSTQYSTTYRVNLANIDNRRVYGYVSIPNGQGPFAGALSLPAFGTVANTALPENHLAENANVISMSISIHNTEPDLVDPNAYMPDVYSDKDGLYYKTAILAGVRAIDYIFSRSDFDGQNLVVTGVSQGAGLSTILAGLDSRVNFLMQSNPVLTQNTGQVYERATGFPNYIQRSRTEFGTAAHEALVVEAVKYYDASFFARRYNGPALCVISYEDLVTPAATSFAVFNALKGPKILAHALDLGHSHPSDFWVGRLDFLRRFVPNTTNPPFPFSSNETGYYISVGNDISISQNSTANLSATIENNMTINPSYNLLWEKISGPGNVSFGSPNSYNTSATFSAAGEYRIRLKANDFSSSLLAEEKYYTLMDELKVTVTGGTTSTGCNNPTNVSENKIATQSSTQQNGLANRAVDGNADGDFWSSQSVTLTNWENQPWWEVDLESVHEVSSINIWNRTDCCQEVLQNYYVFVSENPFTSTDVNSTINQAGVYSYYQDTQAEFPTNISVEEKGRYVRIQLNGSGFLALAEVDVLGCTISTTPNQSDQSIFFPQISDKLTTDNPFELNATASSGLPTSYQVIVGPAYIGGQSNNTVILTGNPGLVIVKASQSGNALYFPAPDKFRSFEVIEPSLLSQSIFFDVIPDKLTTDNPFAINATATSGLSVSYEIVSGPAFLTNDIVTLTGNPGLVTIKASQSGNSQFLPAPDKFRNFEVTELTLLSQSISFDALPNKLSSDNPFTVNAIASSGLPVSFEITSGPANIQGNTITLTGDIGIVSVKATQQGNAQFQIAPEVIRNFVVTPPTTGNCGPIFNIALDTNTSQSGTQSDGFSNRAVDGNTNGDFGNGQSVTNSGWQENAWWETDLGAIADIESINIWNRTDCCQNYLSDFLVFISDVPFDSQELDETMVQVDVSSFLISGSAGVPSVVNINRTGRYIRIQIQTTAFVSLAEVEVMGCFPDLVNTNEVQNNDLKDNITIYPNPTQDIIQVRLHSLFFKNQLQFQIINVDGIVVEERTVTEKSIENLEFSMKGFPDGAYVVKIISDDKQAFSIPFIVTKE